jgi:hypothetical protein
MPHQNLGLLRVDAPRSPPTVTIILAFRPRLLGLGLQFPRTLTRCTESP